ncbi:hypothetical protein M426DRAFT_15272 [Hypoxylon sp. CI-4A]|nr:hypothetical protein M426DRAFT_15272 [Hypoxylon sp. CI-4A]
MAKFRRSDYHLRNVQGQNESLKHSLTALTKQRNEYAEMIYNLTEENARLQSQVENRVSQIMSLQPYHREVTVEDARNGYMDFVQGVNDFIELWTNPILGDDHLQQKSIEIVQKNPETAHGFADSIYRRQDLYDAAIHVPDIDQEVITAWIIRYIWEHVFSTVLCGIGSEISSSLKLLEDTMNESTNPPRIPFAIKSWRSQAFQAMVAHCEIRNCRNETAHELSAHLASLLGFIRISRDADAFTKSILEYIIDPAFSIHEKLLTSPTDFHWEMNPNLLAGQRFSDNLACLEDLDCVDIAKNNRKFALKKLKPEPTEDDIRKCLYIVCSVYPALLATEVSRDQPLEKRVLACKEKVLVAWVPGDDSKESDALKQRPDATSWLHKILTTKSVGRLN